jgi:outer membrane protein assembly factor BamD (BamD/ComL family)
MLRHMTYRLLFLALVSASAFHLSSCGSDDEMPIMAGNNQAAIAEGEKLYQEAKSADDAGKTSKAIKLYDQMATRYPFAPSAAKARFRQAELLEQQGEILKSFDAYNLFLTRFQNTGLYTTALNRQIAMAQSAADGDVKQSMLGLKTKLSLDKTVEMLGKVRDNAPKSAAAAKAQFTIGQLYEGKQESKDAIAAYRQLVRDQPGCQQAPEALFRVGMILTAEADRGNQNQANLDLAKEAFNDYLIQYPGDRRNAEARRMIANLDSRDLQRSYDIATFYEKTGKIESAKVYYRDIVKATKSGDLHDKALARLKELGE